MLNERPLLLTFNPESTAARLFSRRQDDRDLTFVAADNGQIRDEETGSLWNRTQGIAVDGPLKGTQLGHEPAIITFTHKWMLFHSDSKEVTHSDVGPTTEVPVNDELRSRKATPSETDDASIRLKQSDLDPFFHPPAEYANDFGDYRSPLKFYDGRTVKTAADWQTRRREILARWHKVMGPWPSRIEQPQIEYLEKERRENFTQHHVRVEMAPGLTHPAILLVPDGTGPFPAIVVRTARANGSSPLPGFRWSRGPTPALETA
jgi:hypothetical protein